MIVRPAVEAEFAPALLTAVEEWARERGLAWLGSDALLVNEASHRWHGSAGFGEVVRLVVFGKPLR
jgi:aminoglycoside 6'-N-acetyltransferase I